jgi:hypothetical protein
VPRERPVLRGVQEYLPVAVPRTGYLDDDLRTAARGSAPAPVVQLYLPAHLDGELLAHRRLLECREKLLRAVLGPAHARAPRRVHLDLAGEAGCGDDDVADDDGDALRAQLLCHGSSFGLLRSVW